MEKNQPTKLGSISVDAASRMILSLCSQTVEASRLTGRILYRGEGEESGESNLERCKLIFIENSTDLTVEGTYVSNPQAAADYFSSLDRALCSSYTNSLSAQSKVLSRLLSFRPGSLPYIADQSVRPKYGHLATSDIQAASAWGIPVSVWPVDVGFHYAWLRTQSDWWQDEWTRAAPAPRSSSARLNWKQPFFWRSPQLLMEFIKSEVRQDIALETALYTGKELLFSSGISPGSNPLKSHLSYITVPLSDEPALLRKLQIVPFDSKAKVSFSKPMDLDGDAKDYHCYSMRIDAVNLLVLGTARSKNTSGSIAAESSAESPGTILDS
eukprot:gene29251-38321_t